MKHEDDYSDIIHLKHHESKTHPKMNPIDRAAQFAPFAALVGFEEEIVKTSKKVESSYKDSRYE